MEEIIHGVVASLCMINKKITQAYHCLGGYYFVNYVIVPGGVI